MNAGKIAAGMNVKSSFTRGVIFRRDDAKIIDPRIVMVPRAKNKRHNQK